MTEDDLNESRRENGLHPDADGTGSAGEKGCGAQISVSVSFSGDRIEEVSTVAEGSSTAIAAAEVIAARVRGTGWRRAASIADVDLVMDVEASSGKGGREKCAPELAAAFAVEALHGALEDALRHGRFPHADATGDDTVIVAMSGGVDSSTACLLEQRQGRDVIGLTLKLWSDPEPGGNGASCCSPGAILDARQVCHQLGIPHLTFDCAAEFEREVVQYFTTAYREGLTPNPCTRCNGSFRFPLLVRLATELGAAKVATGHYARILYNNAGLPLLARGVDSGKDQSYVLWGIARELLPRIEFPLGEMLKVDTRQLAAQSGLAVYERPESQEVCFIPDDDYRRFLRARLNDMPGEGEIVDTSGRVVGRHGSYTDFTVGQRRGLGVSAPEPLYVVKTEPEHNRVVVGTREELAVSVVSIAHVNIFVPVEEISACDAQLRYNSAAVPARVEWHGGISGLEADLMLEQPSWGVAPGQSAVLYQDDKVIAGGVITAARRTGHS